jgi:hypothetical protein
MVTVAVLDHAVPSDTLQVKLSVPWKSVSGV